MINFNVDSVFNLEERLAFFDASALSEVLLPYLAGDLGRHRDSLGRLQHADIALRLAFLNLYRLFNADNRRRASLRETNRGHASARRGD